VTYPDVDTISDRLPYSPQALGFADSTAYDDTLGNIRDEEIERIEEWGSVVNTQADADALHDGSDPRTAFEQFTVKNDVDGTHAVRTPREHIEETRHVRGDLFFELDKDAHRHEEKRRRALPLPGRPVQSVSSVEDLDRDITLTLDEDVYLENAAALVLDDHAPIAEWHDGRGAPRRGVQRLTWRSESRYPNRATIKREGSATGENAINEPTGESTTTVASDVPCHFQSESTSFVREDSGERVNRPATVRFGPDTDVQEGDTIEVTTPNLSATFEARGVEDVQDARRGITQEIRVDLERAD